MTPWLLLLIPAVLVAVAIDAALEARDRRREPDVCTHYNRCPECAAEPPSRLDRWGRP